MTITIHRSRPLHGEFKIPGDKSISHRALMISALSNGTSEIRGLLESADISSTLQCLRDLGIEILQKGSLTLVHGRGLFGLTKPSKQLNAGNSGTTIRLLSGILTGQSFDSSLTGDDSLRKRPMGRVIEPLTQMGAILEASPSGTPPVIIRGKRPLRAIAYQLPIPSAQVKSAILFAGLFADGTTSVIEPLQSRDHTERMLGLSGEPGGVGRITRVQGGMVIQPAEYVVPGDFSSALFMVCAALLVPGSDIVLRNVGLNPTRTRALDILKAVGARIVVEDRSEKSGEPFGTIRARFSELSGSVVLDPGDIPMVIDEIPVLAAVLSVGGCSFSVNGGTDLRHKESDRISAIVRNLQSMGVPAAEKADGFAFESKKTVFPTAVQTSGDHRIAMAFAVAGMALDGSTTIPDAEIASVSFPDFWEHVNRFQEEERG